MTFSSCIDDQDQVLVLDASVIINLLATGDAINILKALPFPLLVTDSVVHEIGRGSIHECSEQTLLNDLISDGILKVEILSGKSLEIFFEMVSGRTSDSLGDGEAATLALARFNGFSAAIDEKKATRIAREHLGMRLVTTVDILAYSPVQSSLGVALRGATLRALQLARMQVRAHQFEWIVQLIGAENVESCSSLRRLARNKCDEFKVN